jgi:hypothetical protein
MNFCSWKQNVHLSIKVWVQSYKNLSFVSLSSCTDNCVLCRFHSSHAGHVCLYAEVGKKYFAFTEI